MLPVTFPQDDPRGRRHIQRMLQPPLGNLNGKWTFRQNIRRHAANFISEDEGDRHIPAKINFAQVY